MAKTVFVEKNSGHFEYFICHLSDDDKKKVVVENSVIVRKAFQNVDSIEEVSFENCTKIEEFAFENCKELKTVIWAKKKIDSSEKCKIEIKSTSCDGNSSKAISFDGKSTSCDTDKEESTGNIKGISIVEGLSDLSIQHGAFKSCSKLQTVILPLVNNKITIEKEAFAGCSELRTVVFYEEETENYKVQKDVDISEDAFIGCSNLTFVCKEDSKAARYAREHGFRIVNF